MKQITQEILLDNEEISLKLYGPYDENIHLIEERFSVKSSLRGNSMKITGEAAMVDASSRTLLEMINVINSQGSITKDNTEYLIGLTLKGLEKEFDRLKDDIICYTMRGKPIKCKTFGQKKYVEAIRKNEVIFGIGPAGTGKTYLAMAMAITAFKKGEVERLILTRPAVEAGEKLGFLPGDLQDKVDPYLRPLYDALYEIMGSETFQKNMEKGTIEVAPLAYMRGRTLENAYIILDEAQNTTPEQMKMFLTRFGYGSKVIVTGDVTQIDLPYGKKSGLKEVQKILKGIKGIEFCEFTNEDVVRHRLVQRIIDAYDQHEKIQLSFLKKSEEEKEKALNGGNI